MAIAFQMMLDNSFPVSLDEEISKVTWAPISRNKAFIACDKEHIGKVSKTKKVFPDGFSWGTTISGFQAEMGLSPQDIDSNTDWFLWVHDQESINKRIVD